MNQAKAEKNYKNITHNKSKSIIFPGPVWPIKKAADLDDGERDALLANLSHIAFLVMNRTEKERSC